MSISDPKKYSIKRIRPSLAYLLPMSDYFANLREADQRLTAQYEEERRCRELATAIDVKAIEALLATSRTRGGYLETLNALMASEDPAWDVTDDHKGKKLQSCKIGYTNAIAKNDTLNGKVRVVLNSDKLYLIKLATETAPSK